MIPRRAFFFFRGPRGMSWLRKLSVETFRKYNPDWVVHVFREGNPEPGMPVVLESDLFRYEELAANGGVYFDTDIVFFRPFPEDMLSYDVLVGMDEEIRFNNIAVLGSSPENRFYREISESARSRYRVAMEEGEKAGIPPEKRFGGRGMYQFLGVRHLNRMFMGELGVYPFPFDTSKLEERYRELSFRFIPDALVLPISWFEPFKLFNGTPFEPPDGTIGVHWYGGYHRAKDYEKQVTMETLQYWPCYLTECIKKATA